MTNKPIHCPNCQDILIILNKDSEFDIKAKCKKCNRTYNVKSVKVYKISIEMI